MEYEEGEKRCEGEVAEEEESEDSKKDIKNDELWRKIKKYSMKEKLNRLYFYETVWDTLDDTTRFFLNNIGNMIGITARNYGYRVGVLLSMKFEPKDIRFATKEKIYDTTLGAYVFDTKISTVFFNNLLSYDVISKREIEEMVEVPEEE